MHVCVCTRLCVCTGTIVKYREHAHISIEWGTGDRRGSLSDQETIHKGNWLQDSERKDPPSVLKLWPTTYSGE